MLVTTRAFDRCNSLHGEAHSINSSTHTISQTGEHNTDSMLSHVFISPNKACLQEQILKNLSITARILSTHQHVQGGQQQQKCWLSYKHGYADMSQLHVLAVGIGAALLPERCLVVYSCGKFPSLLSNNYGLGGQELITVV